MSSKKHDKHFSTPTDPRYGLTTLLNRRYVEDVLSNSTNEQIAELLVRIRYIPRPQVSQMVSVDHAQVLREETRKYLSTPSGQFRLEEFIRQAIDTDARRFLSSPEGLQKLNALRAELLSDELMKSDDLVNQMCHMAATKKAQEWLASPRGRESVKAMLTRAIADEWHRLPPQAKTTWIAKALNNLDQRSSNAP